MSDLIATFFATLEDIIADEEILRGIYYATLENVDLYDDYILHDLESTSDLFREVYEEYKENLNN